MPCLSLKVSYDDKSLNFLYMNGVIDHEKENRTRYYVKFASPFVQKRLFNYFSRELFHYMGKLFDGFADTPGIITETGLDIPKLLRQYEAYLKKNRENKSIIRTATFFSLSVRIPQNIRHRIMIVFFRNR